MTIISPAPLCPARQRHREKNKADHAYNGSKHYLKLAQALARHENIQSTQRYAHIDDQELDKGYYDIFEKRDDP